METKNTNRENDHDNQTLIMRPHDHIKHITHLTSTGRIHKPILGTKHDLDENSVIIYIYMYIHKTFTMKEGTIYIYISFFCNQMDTQTSFTDLFLSLHLIFLYSKPARKRERNHHLVGRKWVKTLTQRVTQTLKLTATLVAERSVVGAVDVWPRLCTAATVSPAAREGGVRENGDW